MREIELSDQQGADLPASPPDLDHIAHFVPDQAACHEALLRLGFAPTPFSLQYNRLDATSPLTPAGTGNHCVMLGEGYLEFLVPVAETAIAAQLQAAIARYVGVHSIVFGTQDAVAEHLRLSATGFEPAPPIALQRPIDSMHGADTARFTVVRVPPGKMAEGRIQYCQHHTRALVWQDRWLTHPNGALGLVAAHVCVPDLDAAGQRYSRFTGLPVEQVPGRRILQLSRGRIEFYDAQAFTARFAVSPPRLPWIGGAELRCRDIAAARALLQANGLQPRDLAANKLWVSGPASVGGLFIFCAE